jgi:glycosyltransferase involved in cell wall biosynthesis
MLAHRGGSRVTEDGGVEAGEAMRLGIVAPRPPQIGGVSSVAEWLVDHEAEIGCRYDPFDLYRPPGNEMGGRVRLATIPRQARLVLRYLSWLRDAPRVVHFCVSCSPTGLPRDLLYLALARAAHKTTIAHIHGSRLSARDQTRPFAAGLRLLRAFADEVVAVAPTVGRVLDERGIDCLVIMNPIRFGTSSPPARAPRDAGRIRLLFVGWYGRRKGCFDLVEALERVRSRGVDATLTFVGTEEVRGEESGLRALVDRLGLAEAVEFPGSMGREDLSGAYAAADVICLPSYQELLPMSLLEGMAFGLPALATRVGGIPDLVDDGASGLLVEPGDVEAIADAVELWAGDPARLAEMGEAARDKATSLADPGRLVTEWRALYASLTGSSDEGGEARLGGSRRRPLRHRVA